jgi:hypothetical protein
MTIISAGGAVVGAGGPTQYEIERSLRFNSADSAYLNRTPGSASNRKTWTWSGWVKRSNLATGSIQGLFAGVDSGNNQIVTGFRFTSGDALELISFNSGYTSQLVTSQLFRDVSAWYHLVAVYDTSQATSTNRVKIYVNGAQVTAFSTATYPSQNYDAFVNTTGLHVVGAAIFSSVIEHLNGYLTEINFIDGQALDPTSFGEFNTDTGVWEPIEYTGTYGTNGFYLNFSDNASTTTLGDDFSGNGNDWTTNNFSVTAGAGNDSLVDSPTRYGTDTGAGGEVRGNYCTASPLITFTSTDPAMALLNGNLDITRGGAGWGMCGSTIAVSTGKWYWEATFVQSGSGDGVLGIHKTNTTLFQIVGYSGDPGGYGYASGGTKLNNTTGTAYGATYTNGDVIGVALDLDAGTLTFYKNNSSQGTAFSSLSGEFYPAFSSVNGTGVGSWTANFGQRPFAYTAPSGFKALVTTNLPTPTIEKGGDYFNTILYTGTGSSNARTGVGFQPDLVWIKERNGAADHGLYDAVRGVQNQLESNTITAETTEANGLTAFGTDGFTVGSLAQLNTSGDTYVAWNWKANGAGVSNTAGTITSTVSVNTTSGFSIVTYTGNGSNGTVGHGLGTTPSMIIVKNRSSTADWPVYFAGITSATETLRVNSTTATLTGRAEWNSTLPTSTVLSVGNDSAVNTNNDNYVAYCFAEIPGYSAFGSYTGNGSADGPMIFTGFKPKWLLIKASTTAGGVNQDWVLLDTERNTYNVANKTLFPNLSNAEDTFDRIDFLSNGFKHRSLGNAFNGSGATYIYAAFAEHPLKYSLAA